VEDHHVDRSGVKADLSESYASKVHKGDEVMVKFPDIDDTLTPASCRNDGRGGYDQSPSEAYAVEAVSGAGGI